MDNKSRDDVTKSLERAKLTKSYGTEKAFDYLDRTAKKLSNIKTDLEEKEELTEDQEEQQENETSSENKEYESRLQTSENKVEEQDSEEVNQEGVSHSSKLKTNVNKIDAEENIDKVNNPKASKSKLKTGITNKINKTFGFNENQGKISKTVTVVSKTGEKVSKISRTVTRASKDLDKAMSSDGTGRDYLKTSAKRTTKNIVRKKVVNPIKKTTKKAVKKATAPITTKIAQAMQIVIKKAIKLLIAGISAISEFIMPLALVILIIVAICSIFSWGKDTTTSYQDYMTSIQESYDKEVDKFLQDNPTGITLGVRGSYGKIDWRIPLAIMQGVGAELSLDSSEKTLIEQFKSADLLEKHEIIEQTSTDDEGNTTTKKVLVITNATFEEYMDWCNNNFSYIKTFMQNKKVTSEETDKFDSIQLELIKSLYESDNFFDEFDKKYVDYPVKYGENTVARNLKSEYYNSRNTLATSGFKGQCTWFSFGRALESKGKVMPTGNAYTWLSSAVAMGYTTGSRPAPNSVVVLVSKKFGHVAYVESYNGTSITISEGNVGNACSSDDSGCSQVEYANEHAEELVRTKTYSSFKEYKESSKNNGYYIIGFIYLE